MRTALEARVYWGERLLESTAIEDGELVLVGGDGLPIEVRPAGRDDGALARIADGKATVRAPAGGTVRVRRGAGEAWSGPEAGLGPGAVAEVEDGPLRVELRLVPAGGRTGAGFVRGVDLGLARRLAVSSLAAVAVVAATFVVPLAETGPGERLAVTWRPVTPLPPRPPTTRPPRPLFERLPFHRVEPTVFGPPAGPAGKPDRDRAVVERTGLLAGLLEAGGAASAVFGASLGTGVNQALNDLRQGDGLAEAHGVAGLGPRGGAGIGGIGLGIAGLTGGPGARHRAVVLDGGGRDREAVRVNPGKVLVQGGLAKDVIGREIDKHRAAIRACYEQALQGDPSLEGKVAVSFVIDGTGHVADVTFLEDTLASEVAARCIARRIRAWRFPEPQGGGQVLVNYPWIFRAAGGGDE